MVFIHYKKNDKNNFILQFPSDTIISAMLTKLIQYNNIRIYLDRLIWSVQQLANKGVLKPPQLQAVSFQDYQKSSQQFKQLSQQKLYYAKKPKVQLPYRYVNDKNNQRFGVILSQQQQNKLLNATKIGKQILNTQKQYKNINDLLNAIQNIRLAVMFTYPGYIDLPQWQPTYLLLQQKLILEVLQSDNFQLYDEKSLVWWAGKQLDKNKKISDYIGKNQKTKIIIKLQKSGGQQPLRQPPVDSKTYQQMVKYYYKKVDQNKQFQNRTLQTHYQKIQSKTLKQKVHIGDQIKFKPF